MSKEAAAALEEKRAEQALQEYDEEIYGKPVKDNMAKKKVKRIQWNTPFNFSLVEPVKPPPKQDQAFSTSSREEVIYLQRKEALMVPTATKYRPREV